MVLFLTLAKGNLQQGAFISSAERSECLLENLTLQGKKKQVNFRMIFRQSIVLLESESAVRTLPH